jgi:hypothetical protein
VVRHNGHGRQNGGNGECYHEFDNGKTGLPGPCDLTLIFCLWYMIMLLGCSTIYTITG